MPTYTIKTEKRLIAEYTYEIEAESINEALDIWAEDMIDPVEQIYYDESPEFIISNHVRKYDEEDETGDF